MTGLLQRIGFCRQWIILLPKCLTDLWSEEEKVGGGGGGGGGGVVDWRV